MNQCDTIITGNCPTHVISNITCQQINLGGAHDRPVPADIWTIVKQKLADPENADMVATDQVGILGKDSVSY